MDHLETWEAAGKELTCADVYRCACVLCRALKLPACRFLLLLWILSLVPDACRTMSCDIRLQMCEGLAKCKTIDMQNATARTHMAAACLKTF